MKMLMAGFGRTDITPMMGISIRGYFKPRYAEGVLDPLMASALVLSDGTTKIVLVNVDNCGFAPKIDAMIRQQVAKQTGISEDAVFVSCSHTHTGPGAELGTTGKNTLTEEYVQMMIYKIADAAQFALADLKPAKMGWAIGNAPNVAFVRRFRMKDGSIQTNPGVNNPNILEPLGDVDERVGVVRFDQEGGKSLVLVNFANHPDVVGGNFISADWPGFLRSTLEQSIDNTKCIFFNGAQGDVNHVNVHPTGGFLNDTFMDFDDVSRGYGHARYIGRVVTGAVMQVYDKVQYVDNAPIRFVRKTINVPSNRATAEQLVEAKRINDIHMAGKDHELPYSGMMLTTVVAEAARMVALQDGPDEFELPLSAVAVGNVVLAGIPGEPFTGIGRGLKAAEGWDLVLPCCLTNGSIGYFPMMDAYAEGGYEARASRFKAGVAEILIEEGKKLINELK